MTEQANPLTYELGEEDDDDDEDEDEEEPINQKESAAPPGLLSRCCDYSEPTHDRDSFLDNFKGMAGLCVVFIHLGMEPGLYFCSLGKFLGR